MGLKICELLLEFENRYGRDFSEENGWENPPDTKDFQRLLAGDPVDAWTEKLNQFAAGLALGFSEGRYTFWFCDWIINEAWGHVIQLRVADSEFRHPDLLEEVYQAFDDGEWDHRGKSRDPISECTRPQIEGIMSRLSQRPSA